MSPVINRSRLQRQRCFLVCPLLLLLLLFLQNLHFLFFSLDHTSALQTSGKTWPVWSPQDGMALCEANGATASVIQQGRSSHSNILLPTDPVAVATGTWPILSTESSFSPPYAAEEILLLQNPTVLVILDLYRRSCNGANIMAKATPDMKDHSFQVQGLSENQRSMISTAAFNVRSKRFFILEHQRSDVLSGSYVGVVDYVCKELCLGKSILPDGPCPAAYIPL